LDIIWAIKPSIENMKKHGMKDDNFPLIILIDIERIMIKIKVNIRYEIKLSMVNEFKGLIVQEVGLGILIIIPEKPTKKSINPTQTAHQSSDFINDEKTDFKEIYITNITTIH